MKYRHKTTGEIIDVEYSTTEGERPIPRGTMWLGVGDALVRRADGSHEGYQPTHPIWIDFDEVVQTRVVKVADDAGTRYFPERLTAAGWVRGTAMATLAEAEADTPVKPVETVVKAYEGGVLTAELAIGDNPATPQIETTWWQKALAFVGIKG